LLANQIVSNAEQALLSNFIKSMMIDKMMMVFWKFNFTKMIQLSTPSRILNREGKTQD
jgi:hypothetical protein